MFRTVKRIIDWCQDQKGSLYTGFVFSFFSYWFTAAPVVLSACLICSLITGSYDPAWLWPTAGAILILILFRFLFDYLRARFQETISFRQIAKDRLAIGDALKRVSLGYFQNRNTGNILSSITTGMTMLESMGIRMIDTFIGGTLNFIAILIWLLVISPMTALIAIVSAVLSFFFLSLLSRSSEKKAPVLAESDRELTSAVLEYARGLSVVKSFGQDGEASRAINEAIDKSTDIHKKTEWGFIPYHCLHLLALKCGSVGIALAAGYGLLNGQLELMNAMILIFLSLTIFTALEPMSESAHVLGVIDEALNQIEELKQENFIDGNGKEITLDHYDIEFDHVDFGYDERKVLNQVSFRIPEKTSTAIVGPSGSGKTTLVNLLARFYDVNGGSIRIGGHDVREFTCDSLLSNISMVFQNVYLFHDTVRANLCFGRPETTEQEMIEAAKKACCHDFIMKLPQGYDTVIGEGGDTLSGGQKQRISIARAILKDAPVIILDEATASIDPENEHLIQQAISRLTRGKTIITIAHRLSTIEQADQILVLQDGQIIQNGVHSELIRQEGLYRRFMETRQRAEGWSIGK